MDEKKYSVLIVDGIVENTKELTSILAPQYTIYTADNGREALRMAEHHLPDVIILDVPIPVLNGYEVIVALKNSDITKDIPVIFITQLGKADDEEKALSLGASDYITRPFSISNIKLRLGNQIRILEQLRTIRHLSMMDQLTGLPNRRYFENRLRLEWGRAHREKQPISILIVDVDHFKKYNDQYGHQQGDVALGRRGICRTAAGYGY
jgi:PleD family two-component response regulator